MPDARRNSTIQVKKGTCLIPGNTYNLLIPHFHLIGKYHDKLFDIDGWNRAACYSNCLISLDRESMTDGVRVRSGME